jgi:hypothetical protein
MAERLGITQNPISKIPKGKKGPGMAQLVECLPTKCSGPRLQTPVATKKIPQMNTVTN